MIQGLSDEQWKENFYSCCKGFFNELHEGESAEVLLEGEGSQFIRWNGGLIRQSTQVDQINLTIKLQIKNRSKDIALPLHVSIEENLNLLKAALVQARRELADWPESPHLTAPKNYPEQNFTQKGGVLAGEELVEALGSPMKGLDLCGLYTSGPVVRAHANSAGCRHWFWTENYFFDYSLYSGKNRAVKGFLSGKDWNPASYKQSLESSAHQLEKLNAEPISLEVGKYRAYLAPTAVCELIDTIAKWRGFSESALRQGFSPLLSMRSGNSRLSPKFNLQENFGLGLTPNFNEQGSPAPESLALVEEGQLKNTLVNAKSAKEFDTTENGADFWESARSVELLGGNLDETQALEALGEGLFINNLHYLNWSDPTVGRVTGMTRFACFWVEGGKIKAPMPSMRFDDSIFNFFGDKLVELTQQQRLFPETGSYGHRHLGGAMVPGALVSEFQLCL